MYTALFSLFDESKNLRKNKISEILLGVSDETDDEDTVKKIADKIKILYRIYKPRSSREAIVL